LSLLQNSNAISSGGYNLESSLRFRKSGSAYLTYTPTTSSGLTKFTVSFWMKRGKVSDSVANVILSAGDSTSNRSFLFFGSNTDVLRWYSVDGGVYRSDISWNMSFRDPSAWYHIVFVYDESNATTSDKIILYVNGVRQSGTFAQTPTGGHGQWWGNSGKPNYIGRRAESNSDYFDGYLTEFNYIPNQALAPSDFGETDATTGVWKPKEYLGTYGTNGFYLPFKETQQATGFNTVLYTGNGGTQSIDNVGFSPDLVWLKQRDGARDNALFDTVRGATKQLSSNSSAAESTQATMLTSFDSDGFTVGSDNPANISGGSFVAWCWDAGSSTVSNTDGTITSTVRANPASGFSIVSYVGTGTTSTIGHGLSSAPDMIITKNRDIVDGWFTYHSSLGSDQYMNFWTTAAAGTTLSDYWGPNEPTSSVFGIGTYGGNNTNGNNYIAYCFSEVAGYSKFGSYTGNGSTSGPTVTTGFTPAFVMMKRTNSTSNWLMFDRTRGVDDNLNDNYLYANASGVEGTSSTLGIEITSTGFVLKNAYNDANASGGAYIYMAFADTRDAQFNFDASGNKNNWTANNINSNASSETTYDIMNDVATLTDEDTANFCTYNPNTTMLQASLASGNLDIVFAGSGGSRYGAVGTMGMSSGKWYWETTITGTASSTMIGITQYANSFDVGTWPGAKAGDYGYNGNGNLYTNSSSSAYGGAMSTNDVIGIALDMNAGTLTFYKNNVSQGVAATGLSGTYFAASGQGQTSVYPNQSVNFGQRPFKYTPPTGYKKLNTYNLPDSTIVEGSEYFITNTFTGTGSTLSIDTGFSPDFVWLKSRSFADHPLVYDSIRGANQRLYSSLTNAESTANNQLNSFDSDGYTLGSDPSGQINVSGQTSVGWSWRGSDSSPVTNTDGTITSTVSANIDSGFSVITFTGNGTAGATIGHGLGAKPAMIIVKNRTYGVNWRVYHESLGATKFLSLNLTNAVGTSSLEWNNTEPTSSIITVGTSDNINRNGDNIVMYAFADVEGFSKFGKYTGNGSSDGPFVYTGFRPAFILQKNTNAAYGWLLWDTSRSSYNMVTKYLVANTSDAEVDTAGAQGPNIDILSNGFKVRDPNAGWNQNGSTHIYMAFAENPFKNSLAR